MTFIRAAVATLRSNINGHIPQSTGVARAVVVDAVAVGVASVGVARAGVASIGVARQLA